MNRILSLSGGGVWGLCESTALAALYPGKSGRAILAEFGFAIGTSAGGIVLAGLIADMRPDEITAMFLDQAKREQIFVPLSGSGGILGRMGIGPKWSSTGKLAGLSALLGSAGAMPLSKSPIPVAFTTFDVDRHRTVLLTSYGDVGEVTLAAAAHASSTAPVLYFDEPAVIGSRRLWDGGCAGLGNPVALGVVEAQQRVKLARPVAALALGTGTVWRPEGPAVAPADPRLYALRQRMDEVSEISIMAGAVLDDPPDEASWQAWDALDGELVLASPFLAPAMAGDVARLPEGWAALGGTDAYATLCGAPMDCSSQATIALMARMAEAWVAGTIPNQPIRFDETTGALEQGDATFPLAAGEWRAMCGC